MKKIKLSQDKCSNSYCKTTKSPVSYVEDPFQAEINNIHTKVWLCEDCRHESSMDI